MHFNQQSWHRKTTMVTATMIWETQTIWYISNLLQNLKNRKVSFFSYFQDLYSTLCLFGQESDWTPGRVLDTRKVLERVFDLEGDRILLKFHREGGQIFCKTVEFFMPARASHVPAAQTDQANSKVKSSFILHHVHA